MLYVNPGAIIAAVNATNRAIEQAKERREAGKLKKEARAAETPPERLTQIAWAALRRKTEQPKVWQAVLDTIAGNAGSPPETLALLVARCPRAICGNPVIPMLMLGQPEWLNTVSPADLGPLLRLPDVSEALVAGIAAFHPDPEATLAARLHVAFDGEAKAGWEQEMSAYWWDRTTESNTGYSDRELERDLAESDLAPEWIAGPRPWREPARRYTLTRQKPESSLRVKSPSLLEAEDPATPVRQLARLAHSKEHSVVVAVSLNPASTAAVLRRICRRQWVRLEKTAVYYRWMVPEWVAERAVSHPNADAWLLRRLARSPQPIVRRLARRHSNAPEDLRRWCRSSCLRGIRDDLQNPHVTPSSVLSRFFLLQRPEIGYRSLWRAADSRFWHDRLAATMNPRIDRFRLRRLAKDANIWVRAAAQKRLRGERISWDHGSG